MDISRAHNLFNCVLEVVIKERILDTAATFITPVMASHWGSSKGHQTPGARGRHTRGGRAESEGYPACQREPEDPEMFKNQGIKDEDGLTILCSRRHTVSLNPSGEETHCSQRKRHGRKEEACASHSKLCFHTCLRKRISRPDRLEETKNQKRTIAVHHSLWKATQWCPSSIQVHHRRTR